MIPAQNKVKAYHRDNVNKAIELAEQEAEKRVLDKVSDVFKRRCVFRDSRCKPNCKGCKMWWHFIEEIKTELR